MQIDFDALSAFVRAQLIRDAAMFEQQQRAAWRASGAARWEHTARVLKIAQDIAQAEGADFDVVTVAAIFHDAAKFQIDGNAHAERSAAIARAYLTDAGFDAVWIERVCNAIAHHVEDDTSKFTLEDCILRDADLMDETGALGIVWTCMNAGRLDATSYREARERIVKHDLQGCQRVIELMLTRTGRRMARQRLAFVEAFVRELDSEMGKFKIEIA